MERDKMTEEPLEIINHGPAWLSCALDPNRSESTPLAASRMVPKRSWEHVLKLRLEDCSTDWASLGPGVIRFFVSHRRRYLSDDNVSCDDVDRGYFADLTMPDNAGSDLLIGAADTVLALMQQWAQDQLDLSKPA